MRQYRENLEDLREWGTEEGVLKKVGSINRLLDVDGPASLPHLDYQQLPGANFQGVDLKGLFQFCQHQFCFPKRHLPC